MAGLKLTIKEYLVNFRRVVPSVLWQAIQKGQSKSSAPIYFKSTFIQDRHDMVRLGLFVFRTANDVTITFG
jgi:hypothetical protein